jgi:hypothetical protein
MKFRQAFSDLKDLWIRSFGKEEKKFFEYGCYTDGTKENFYWFALKQFLRGARCCFLGHDLEEDGGWCGPDSGGIGVTCKRCGYSWSHTLY